MTSNPYIEQFFESCYAFGDQVIASEGQTDATIIWQGLIDNARATLAEAYATETANLIAVYESVICDTLNGAERLELENTILERTGIRDA